MGGGTVRRELLHLSMRLPAEVAVFQPSAHVVARVLLVSILLPKSRACAAV